MWQLVIGGVTNLIGTWMKHRQERSQAKHEAKLVRIANVATWEQQAQQNAETSFKDEFWTIVLAIPCIGAFLPFMVPHIMAGFDVLEQMPNYYKAFVGASIGASFGYRKLVNWKANEVVRKKNDQ